MKKKINTRLNQLERLWYDTERFVNWVRQLGGHAKVATRIGVDIDTLRLYCDGKEQIPTVVYTLLELLCTGQLGQLLGKEWSEILLTPEGLQLPGWRRPLSPTQLRSLFVLSNGKAIAENTLHDMQKRLESAEASAEAWEKKARFYRNQLIAESRLGLMLTNLNTP